MATRLQIRQGTNTENDNFTGAPGELTFDTTNKEIRIHDGTTQGGITIANKQLLDTKLDKNISLNYNHITNCITEIPQDIKLELNNGTLTLKAGSKVYVPNGTGVFDIRNVTADKTYSQTTNGQYLLFARQDTTIWGSLISEVTVGTTPPTGTGTFYNTKTNSIDWYSSGTYNERHYSLPFALITVSNGTVSSIDQVFNGFGYIGRATFALPGVKLLHPNRRNADGTLKNTEVTISNLIVNTNNSITVGWRTLYIDNTGTRFISADSTGDFYSEKDNIYYKYDYYDYLTNYMPVGIRYYDSNVGTYTTFVTKTAFHAVDYNDSNYISQQGMPSSKYVNIPVDKIGTTGTAHTAPGNGYFVIRTVANIADCTLTFQSAQEPYYGNSLFIPQGNDGRLFVPVKKGDQVKLYYTNLGTGTGDQATVFNFIYSQGQ